MVKIGQFSVFVYIYNLFLQEDPNLNEKYLYSPRVLLRAFTQGVGFMGGLTCEAHLLCRSPEHYFDITNFGFDQIASLEHCCDESISCLRSKSQVLIFTKPSFQIFFFLNFFYFLCFKRRETQKSSTNINLPMFLIEVGNERHIELILGG